MLINSAQHSYICILALSTSKLTNADMAIKPRFVPELPLILIFKQGPNMPKTGQNSIKSSHILLDSLIYISNWMTSGH